ncbi:predicted protein [Naegleria gruberi]|uniref:Predicted protein n=1 Tax=Naegleria gruberi TaxID=5762 RepID=D2V1C9_NAEGR|nr:uncharacterized protein NAEGRDRAFT_62535 [Naegleria gruberi]EFC49285.1 predicted protein [Naegleria gruberi]|eukprot:XP_002682029.1 predicted protein [Naegleria gruberi strain NEG-M]
MASNCLSILVVFSWLLVLLVHSHVESTATTFTFSKEGQLLVSNREEIRKLKDNNIVARFECGEACKISELVDGSGENQHVLYLHNKTQIRSLSLFGDSSILVEESVETIQSFFMTEYDEIIYSTGNHIKKRLLSGYKVILAGSKYECQDETNDDECIRPGHVAQDAMSETIYFYDYRTNLIRKIEDGTIRDVKGTFGYFTFDIKHGIIYCSDGTFIKRIQPDLTFDIIGGRLNKYHDESPDETLAKHAFLDVMKLRVSPVWGEEEIFYISRTGSLRMVDSNNKLKTIMDDSDEIQHSKPSTTHKRELFKLYEEIIDNNSTNNNSTNSTMDIDYYPNVNITGIISPDGSGIKFIAYYGRSDVYTHQLFFSDDSGYDLTGCMNYHEEKSIKLTLLEKNDTELTQSYTSNYIPLSTLLESSSVRKTTFGNYWKLDISLSAQYVDQDGHFHGDLCYNYIYNATVSVNLWMITQSISQSLTVDNQNFDFSVYPNNFQVSFDSNLKVNVDLYLESHFEISSLIYTNSTSSIVQSFSVNSFEHFFDRNFYNYSKYSLEGSFNSYDIAGAYQFKLSFYDYNSESLETSFQFSLSMLLSDDVPQTISNQCTHGGLALTSTKCFCQAGYYGDVCQSFNCYGNSSVSDVVCSGHGQCSAPDVCSCIPIYGGSVCQNILIYHVSAALSSTLIVKGDSQVVTATVTATEYPIQNLMFTLICLNCELVTTFQSTDSFSLDFSNVNTGSYYFTLYGTTIDTSIKSQLFDFVVQVTSQTFRAVQSLESYGIPTYYLHTSKQVQLSAIISNITLSDYSQVSDFNCLYQDCSFSYSYSIKLRSLSSTQLLKSSNGMLNGNGNQFGILLSPPLSLSTVVSLESLDITKITVDLNFRNGLQNFFTFIEIPVLSLPKIPDVITIEPSTGVAIATRFNISSSGWIADFQLQPLSFAYGFFHPTLQKSIRITQFTTVSDITFPLPFVTNDSLPIIAFVQDVNGNLQEYSIGSVIVTSYPNSTADLMNSTCYELKNVLLYDQSIEITPEVILQKVIAIEISQENAETALSALNVLTKETEKVTTEIVTEVTKKVDTYMENVVDTYTVELNTYGYVKSKVSTEVLTSTLQVLSNIISTDNTSTNTSTTDSSSSPSTPAVTVQETVEQTLTTFNTLVMKGQVPTVLSSTGSTSSDDSNKNNTSTSATTTETQVTIPSETYSSPAIVTTVATIVLQTTTAPSNSSQTSASQTNPDSTPVSTPVVKNILESGFNSSVVLNIASIAKSTGGTNAVIGLSSVTYAKNVDANGNKTASSIIDFKYYQNYNLTKLSDLADPIVLNLAISKEEFTKFTNETEIVCKFWDETCKNWKTKGMLFIGLTANQVNCSSNHTTKFSTFIEYKQTNVTGTNDKSSPTIAQAVEISKLYYAEIAFGVVFTLLSGFVLVMLIIFRNKQPVSSRLITPYLGMIALLTESILISIVQRSVLIDYLFQTNTNIWEEEQNSANIVGNVTMIIVNTLNLTAILSYVIQVVRFELLKLLYGKISTHKPKGSVRFRFLKVLTSARVFMSIIISFAILNILYWTLWVILVRTNVIPAQTYTYIVSISYTVIIFLFSIIISLVAIIDISVSYYRKRSRGGFRNLESMGSTDLNSLRKKTTIRISNIKGKVSRAGVQVFSLDSPLFFRTEMAIYLVYFALLIVQQSLGLTSNEYRFKGTTVYDTALKYDVAVFIMEVLYQFCYVLVFGGFSLLILLKLYIQKKVNLDKIGNISKLSIFLQDQDARQVFEKFCQSEFSTENIYLYDYLLNNELFTSGRYLDGISDFLKNIHDLFMVSNAVCEVNVPSTTRKKFILLYKQVNVENKDLEMMDSSEGGLRKQIADCFNDLQAQIELNMEDTFSRFITSQLYDDFLKQKDLKVNFAKQMRVDLE